MLAGFILVDRNGCAGGAEVDAVTTDDDGVVLVKSVPSELLARHADHLLDQNSREVEPSMLVDPSACRDNHFYELLDWLTHPELLKKGQSGLKDGVALRVTEWLVGAAAEAWPDSLLVFGRAGGPGGNACSTSTGPSGAPARRAHVRSLSLLGSWEGPSNTVAVCRSPNRVTSKVEPGSSKVGST